jgi:hypothetical protein
MLLMVDELHNLNVTFDKSDYVYHDLCVLQQLLGEMSESHFKLFDVV